MEKDTFIAGHCTCGQYCASYAYWLEHIKEHYLSYASEKDRVALRIYEEDRHGYSLPQGG